MISPETTVSFPNFLPANSGNTDGNLFEGTLPKRLPAFFRPDPVVGGGCESGIGDDLLGSSADDASVRDELDAVPHPHAEGDLFDGDEAEVGQDQFALGDAVGLLPPLRIRVRPEPPA